MSDWYQCVICGRPYSADLAMAYVFKCIMTYVRKPYVRKRCRGNLHLMVGREKPMSEKLFVIMEVTDTHHTNDGLRKYVPANVGLTDQAIWLKPERVIPASRLRYGVPKVGEDRLTVCVAGTGIMGWKDSGRHKAYKYGIRLILDPPEEPKTDWQVWMDRAPSSVCDEVRKWVDEMPPKDK